VSNARSAESPGPNWSALDERFRGPLVAYFSRRVGSQAEAEDLTQEVLLRLMRQADQPRDEATQAYVFVTAANLLKDRARQAGRHGQKYHHPLEEFDEAETIPGALVEDRTPERVLRGEEALAALLTALEDLSERTRDIFILSRIEHVQQRDIAALFGISVSAVEKHVMKALSHIGRRLAQP